MFTGKLKRHGLTAVTRFTELPVLLDKLRLSVEYVACRKNCRFSDTHHHQYVRPYLLADYRRDQDKNSVSSVLVFTSVRHTTPALERAEPTWSHDRKRQG